MKYLFTIAILTSFLVSQNLNASGETSNVPKKTFGPPCLYPPCPYFPLVTTQTSPEATSRP
jgi:hypothetical protein